MPCSTLSRLKRALVTVLLSLASAYGIITDINRDSERNVDSDKRLGISSVSTFAAVAVTVSVVVSGGGGCESSEASTQEGDAPLSLHCDKNRFHASA